MLWKNIVFFKFSCLHQNTKYLFEYHFFVASISLFVFFVRNNIIATTLNILMRKEQMDSVYCSRNAIVLVLSLQCIPIVHSLWSYEHTSGSYRWGTFCTLWWHQMVIFRLLLFTMMMWKTTKTKQKFHYLLITLSHPRWIQTMTTTTLMVE